MYLRKRVLCSTPKQSIFGTIEYAFNSHILAWLLKSCSFIIVTVLGVSIERASASSAGSSATGSLPKTFKIVLIAPSLVVQYYENRIRVLSETLNRGPMSW